MQECSNLVQNYIEEINKIKIPDDEEKILDFLGTLDSEVEKKYLSFILSQSHIFNSMTAILDVYNHNDFYFNAGYSDKTGKIVPKLDKDGKIYYEEFTSYSSIDKMCRDILDSLQNGDKKLWNYFLEYVKSIYEPSKMDIYNNPQLGEFNQIVKEDFINLSHKCFENDSLRNEINELINQPVLKRNGFIGKIKTFFEEIKKEKKIIKKESMLQDDSRLFEEAIMLIRKYKKHENVTVIMKNQLDFAEKLIEVGVPKDVFIKILSGLADCVESSSFYNCRISDLLKELRINALIAEELYSYEILYAKTFQEMVKNIRILLIKNNLKEYTPITTEYRKESLRNRMLASEDISVVLKGKDLSQKEIQTKMEELDEEFNSILKEENVFIYIKRCTDLMMKFISIHPFGDENDYLGQKETYLQECL